MAKFLNKKEQVYDLRLTSYGRHLLSVGRFKPTYYAFYDDNVLYDRRYASTGSGPELQNSINERIKKETQYLESLVLFEEVETSPKQTDKDGEKFNIDINPTKVEPRKDFFKFDSMIGDAFLDGNPQAAPAWKIVTLQGDITSSATEDLKNATKIPQINVELRYTKEVSDYRFDLDFMPEEFSDFAHTEKFADGKIINLKLDDAVIYAEEVNTELLTENFDIEVFEIGDYTGIQATGSIVISSLPSNGDTVVINDGVSSVGFTFVNTTTGSTDVSLGSANVYGVTKALLVAMSDSSLATNMTFERPVDNLSRPIQDTIELKSRYYGPYYNILIVSSNTSAVVVAGMEAGVDGTEILKRKYFQKTTPQVQDGLMMSAKPESTPLAQLTTASVEYYFDVLTDFQIEQEVACKSAEVFNKESYYVDLDFDCRQEKEDLIFNDIYGKVTEPEICLD